VKPDTSRILPLIEAGLASPDAWPPLLDAVLAAFDCSTGTIHTLDPDSGKLALAAQRGIPGELMPMITSIPIGKGIAGAAAERREAVQLCNLQTDDSGVARPDAKKTQVSGSIAIPLLSGDELKGTLGIGKFIPYEFTADDIASLWQIGNRIANAM
jgi:putative methionine-R-sulfoxide reductase with GAF domain